MKKGRISNVLQRIFIFGSVTMLMAGFVFNGGNLVNADGTIGSKVEKCALNSVTMKVTSDQNAEEETYAGGLKAVLVDKDASWNDYFSIRKITAISFGESNVCTAKDAHEYVSAYVLLPEGTEYTYDDFRSYAQKTNDGVWLEIMNTSNMYNYDVQAVTFGCTNHINESYVSLDESVGYYDMKIEPRFGMIEGTSPTGIYVRFAKQYAITYDLAGGTVTNAEEVYTAGTEYTLPTPTKEGYYFAGWTGVGLTEPTRNVVIPIDATGDRSYTANWVKAKNINVCTVTLKDGEEYTYTGAEIKPEVIVKDGDTILVKDTDYTVEYANNVKVATKDSTAKPSVIVKGLGKYTGTVTICFTIESPLPDVGDKQKDVAGKATYKVTETEDGDVEVTYVKPSSKKKTVTIPATVTLADGTKAEVTAVDTKAFKGDTKLQTITIGKNVETIGKEAFKGCKNLKKIKGSKNVEKIGKNAFANCTKLTSVAMGDDVESIGEKAFYKCSALKKITIPEDVKSIGKSAFQGCKKLKNITIKTTKLTKKNVKKNAFKGIPSNAKINVPNSKVKAYKSILRARGVSKRATIK